MNRKVQVYIEGQRLELFNDEQIEVTSTQQNVSDISKTYTDFSQAFTIPASPYNNAIMQHFYQTDVNSTIDHNLRRNAVIEIDLTFFRRGKIQIEKSQIKNGQVQSYTLGFFGEGKTLLDYFGEDNLADLDYTDNNHDYTGPEVKARIQDGTNAYDVKYPLISSKRVWTYTGQTPTSLTPVYYVIPTGGSHDIHQTAGHIHFDELFPALRVKEIFHRIEDKYGVTFNGNFLSDDRFTKLFLWYKNKNEFNFFSESKNIDFQNISTNFISGLNPYNPSDNINLTNNTITLTNLLDVTNYKIKINITSSSALIPCLLDVYQNGNLLQSMPFTGVTNLPQIIVQNTSGLNVVYNFKVRSTALVTIDSEIRFEITTLLDDPLTGQAIQDTNYAIIQNFVNVLPTLTDLASLAPEMKISEFFSGICKLFNLTCYASNVNDYQLEPLDDWYSQGAIVDISQYTDVNNIGVDRMKLYKKINMKFKDSDCFLNKQFTQLFNRGYGNTSYEYNYDGGDFTLEVPFENLLQNKFTGSDLQVGYSLNNEFAPYVPKPVLLYQYDNKDVDFKFNNGGTTSTITNYTPFGQDLYTNLTDYTLNFAPDISTMLNVPVQQTLFGTYYFSYLYNLYNLKQRLISVKTILPISLLTKLQLNDRLVIRDKRYIINSMKSNLTTGEVNFELILDFRPMINSTQTPYVDISGGNVNFSIDFVNGAVSAFIYTSEAGVTISPDTIDSSQLVTVNLPAGSAGTVYVINVRFTLENGTIQEEKFKIIQQ